jgi:hypothetical protein
VTCHGSTLLPQFLAMYRVTVESEDTYLIVMRNMFSHRLNVHRKYDLKVSIDQSHYFIKYLFASAVVIKKVLYTFSIHHV